MDNLHLYHILEDVLRMEERFCTADGQLIKNSIIEAALSLQPNLIKLLLGNDELSANFFSNIEGVKVFDKVKFQRFVMNKSFLADSYTAYKNKIGLTDEDGRFLSESREVVLSWPYKDCVLEGGQTKEDAKRDEIFWSETLAPDEINRLTEPKAFTGFKRYDKDGEHSVEQLLTTDNLIIKGNNLLALYSLRKKFGGRVKLIYIDPPFNTGNDSFKYNDQFNHSTWLVFMRNRLMVAKELLANNGLIFIHIDDIEDAYLKVLADEIFGRNNFVNVIAVRSSTPSGTKTAHKDKTIIKQKDMILVYKGGDNIVLTPQYTKRKKWDPHYSLILDHHDDGSYSFRKLVDELYKMNILKDNQKLEEVDIDNAEFKQYYMSHAKDICRLQSHKNKDAEQKSRALTNRVYEDIVEGKVVGLYYNGQVITPLAQGVKRVYSEQKFVDDLGMLLCDFWDDIDFQNTQNEGGISFPTAKKPEMLIYRLIDMCTKPREIVMDFFLGSGTTAAVAHKMNRQYIGIEQLDYGENDCVVRLMNVINGEQSGASKGIGWLGGGSFVYCELAKANDEFVEKIQAATTTEALQSIWTQMKETGYLNYKIDIATIDANAADFEALSINNQKRFLIECLDKNLLYVPFSDIDSEEYSISDEDKRLTREFYKKV